MSLAKNIFLSIAVPLLVYGKLHAQIQSVQIGVNGLTCSQCSRSVEMSIRKLDFVKEVRMNLKNTEGEIFFNEGYKADINKIAKAVVDAGFSVRYLKATIYFKQLPVSENYCWINERMYYQFIKTNTQMIDGITTVTFINKQFMPKPEYKKWSTTIKEAQGKGCEAKQIFYITL